MITNSNETEIEVKAEGILTFSQDSDREAQEYIDASSSPNTQRAYGSNFKMFALWCEKYNVASLPASPENIVRYASMLAKEGNAVNTIQLKLTAISQIHEARKHESPCKTAIVRKVMKGIANTIGTRLDKVEPLLTDHFRAISAHLDKEGTIKAKRDKALLLIGFAAARRRSELAAITFEDISFKDDRGVIILIRKSKTDQEGRGVEKAIKLGRVPSTCPVRALREWLEASKIASGPIFVGIMKGGKLREKPMSGQAVANIVKQRCGEVGLDSELFSGHSMRRGFVTQGMQNGVSERTLANMTDHKSLEVLRGYGDSANVWQDNGSDALGL